MIQGPWRRNLRRVTAALVGTAVAAATISLAAPANAAESTIGGIVTDASGNPLSGGVYAYYPGFDGTYSEGRYRYVDLVNGVISGTLPDGTYKLEAQSSGGYSEFYLDKPDLASADVVSVAGGAVGLARWVLEQPYVTATVTDPAGRPVQGATVAAYDAADATDIITVATSDEHGQAVLPVPATPVKIHTSSNGKLGSEWYSDKADFASADPVTGTPAGAALAIGLAPRGGITGQVLSDAGVPLEQVRVTAMEPSGSGSYYERGTDYTDKNGVFVLDNMSSGSYLIEFSDRNIKEYTSEYWNNAPDPGTATKVTVTPGQLVSGINANLTPRPAEPVGSVELTGVVTDDSGAPVVGALVDLYDMPAAPVHERNIGDDVFFGDVYTNRAGIYTVDDLDAYSGKSVKLQASLLTPGDEKAYTLFSQWFGQRTSYDRAAPVAVTAGVPARADISLPRAGGIAGTVKGAPGLPLNGAVSVLSADGVGVLGTYTGSIGTESDDTFDLRSLYPGTYKVMFLDATGRHVPEWWRNSGFEDAKEIVVKSGQTVTGLDAVLEASLATTERPALKGYPWVGKSIKVDRGEWNFETGTQYSYEWLIGSKVVGTGDSYTPTKRQIGDRLKVRVLAENGELSGIATTARSAKIGYKAKIKAKVRGDRAFITVKVKGKKFKAKKIKGKVTVKEIVRVKNNGKIKYKKIGKTKIKGAKGTVSLKKLKKGKHKVVFFFKGKGKVGSAELTKKVKTKR